MEVKVKETESEAAYRKGLKDGEKRWKKGKRVRERGREREKERELYDSEGFKSN